MPMPTLRTLLPLLALAIAAPVAATALEGRYKLTEGARCDAEDGAGLLRIENGVLYGARSRCRMTSPSDVRDMNATLYDMVCIGEGTGWEERALLMRAASGGLILVWEGYAFEYEACPEPPVRPRARPGLTGSGDMSADSTSGDR